jgi:hypothetical protein
MRNISAARPVKLRESDKELGADAGLVKADKEFGVPFLPKVSLSNCESGVSSAEQDVLRETFSLQGAPGRSLELCQPTGVSVERIGDAATNTALLRRMQVNLYEDQDSAIVAA